LALDEKKVGEKFWSGAKNLGENFSQLPFFSPDKVLPFRLIW